MSLKRSEKARCHGDLALKKKGAKFEKQIPRSTNRKRAKINNFKKIQSTRKKKQIFHILKSK